MTSSTGKVLLLALALSCLVTVSNGQLLRNVYKTLLEQKARVEAITQNLGLFNQTIGRLMGDIAGMKDLSPTRITQCYAAELQQFTLNIFDPLATFKSIASLYYRAFPKKLITADSMSNLLASTREIVTFCMTRTTDSDVKYGYTFLSDLSAQEFSLMRGIQFDSDGGNSTQLIRKKRYTIRRQSIKINGIEQVPSYNNYVPKDRRANSNKATGCHARPASVPSSFDWRSRNKVTPVRSQQNCGSCWAHAALASLEGVMLIRGRTKKTANKLDLSEQHLVQCAKPGTGCNGGNSYMVFSYLRDHGVNYESEMPYTAKNGYCPSGKFPNRYTIKIKDFCVRSSLGHNAAREVTTERLTDQDIINSLVQFGPLYMTVNTKGFSKNYRGGVMNWAGCGSNSKVDHAIALVGYTPGSWILKNSWGTSWGNAGYFEVVRGQNWCGINSEIAWPIL